MTRTLAALTAAAVCALLPATAASAAPSPYENCTALNETYAHGIGRADAVDKVAKRSKPVTTFKKDTKGYEKAMRANKGLDRDKDGIACEKR